MNARDRLAEVAANETASVYAEPRGRAHARPVDEHAPVDAATAARNAAALVAAVAEGSPDPTRRLTGLRLVREAS